MLKFEFLLLCFLISILGAKSAEGLFLPSRQDGVLRLELSNTSDSLKEPFEYLSVFVSNEVNEYALVNRIQGRYTKEGNSLIFEPYFPFDIGFSYVVRAKLADDAEIAFVPFQIGSKQKVDQAKVVSIHPLADFLPENLLRFYIYFKTPMRQEEALQHIKLIDDAGKVDDHAFMKFKEELWSNDGRRLTVLFDPGRIKRGVGANSQNGPSLETGRSYQLRVSGDWEDVYGQKLQQNSVKQINIVKAYRQKMDLNNWSLEKPSLNSLDVVTLRFDRIIDHAIVQSAINIVDEQGAFINGYWEIPDSQRLIYFVPKTPWKKGKYRIEFDTLLEDISGNNLENLLDHHISEHKVEDGFQFIGFSIL